MNVTACLAGDLVLGADRFLIKRVDPQLWHAVIVEHDDKVVVHFVNVDVRGDILGCVVGIFAARPRFEALDDIDGRNDVIHADLQGADDGFVISLLEIPEVILDNFSDKRIVDFEMSGLDHQTFAEIPRGHPDRIEGLDERQYLFDFFHFGTRYPDYFFQGDIEVAVLVEIAHDKAADVFLQFVW